METCSSHDDEDWISGSQRTTHDQTCSSDDDEDWISGSQRTTNYQRGDKRGRPVGSGKRKQEEDQDEEQHSKKRTKKDLIPIVDLLSLLCCSLVCMADIAIDTLVKIRGAFQDKSQMERTTYLMDWVRDHTNGRTTNFFLGTQRCCMEAWLAVHGVAKSTLYQVRKRLEEGKAPTMAGNWRGTLTPKGVMAMVWLEAFARKSGDKLPNQQHIHLPCCLTRKSVHVLYKQDEENAISEAHFLRIWRKHLPHIKIPKVSRFTICDVCAKITSRLQKTTSKEERREIRDYRDAHLKQQNTERQKYYKHISKSKSSPDKYMSVIMDGMDQDKTSVPHFTSVPKSISNLWMLRINLTGVIVHGLGIFGFFDCFKYAHGSSYTVSVLIHTLSMMTRLPPTLYLQLDNCPGSNKNRYMLGFLAALVEAGVFKKVKLSFLMVGHTHEDIDQVFSRYSYWLKMNAATTMADLLTGFENCYQPKPKAISMSHVYDVQKWLDIDQIRNHSKPHIFKLQLQDGKAQLYVKQWSTTQEWQHVPGNILKNMDLDKPIVPIVPTTDRIDPRVDEDIQTVMRFYDNKQGAEWWSTFFRNLYNEETDATEQPVIDQLRKLSAQPPSTETTGQVLDGLPALDLEMPQVCIGPKQRKKNVADIKPAMKCEDFVLCDLDKYSDEWPQIGKIVAIDQVDVQVHWFKGSMSSVWTPVSRRLMGARGGKTEPFMEWIKKTDVFHYGFSLTPSGKLTKNVKDIVDNYKN